MCARGSLSSLQWLLGLRHDDHRVLAPTDPEYSEDSPKLFDGKLNDRTKVSVFMSLTRCTNLLVDALLSS